MGGFATGRPSTAGSPRSARRTRARGAEGPNSVHTASAVAGMNGWDRTARRATVRARFASTDRKSTRLNSSHDQISYAVFCLKKKKKTQKSNTTKRGRKEVKTD